MYRYISIIILILFFSGVYSKNLNPHTPVISDVDICEVENRTFDHGETIVYKIYYNWNFIWLSAGEVVFRVKELDDHYHLSASGYTYPSYEWFFKVRDYFESKVDKETLLPFSSVRDVHEGKYTRYDKIKFDQNNRVAVYHWGDNKESDLKSGVKDLEGCIHDIISVFYSLRNTNVTNLEEGSSFPVEVFLDKEVWPLNVELASKNVETRIKSYGKQNTSLFVPELVAGNVFKEGAKMNVYVSNDGNRIPLMIESPVSVGSVKAIIKNWYNLKEPLILD